MFDVVFTQNEFNHHYFKCRSWREVRKSVRAHRIRGYTLTRCRRVPRIPGYWREDRTLNRAADRALRELA